MLFRSGPNRSWRLCVLDWCACVLQIRCAPEELQLSFYCFRDSSESVRCEYNLDHHWQLWRECLSTRREFARAVYPPPVTAVLVPIRYIVKGQFPIFDVSNAVASSRIPS